MKSNTPAREVNAVTHEGGPAVMESAEKELHRTVSCLMLFEDTFYESGKDIAARVSDLCSKVSTAALCGIAKKARTDWKLRHAPLYLMCEALKKKGNDTERNLIGQTISEVIQRADELSEILAIYWREKRHKVPRQLKAGIAKAFQKFSAYNLAKYNRDGKVKLRDALFICHAKPKDEEQQKTWEKLIDNKLEAPDTWEVQLSAGKDKGETFTRLITEGKLGYMALLRNLRNMTEANVDRGIITKALLEGAEGSKALPYRFVAAAKFAPAFADVLSDAMERVVSKEEKLAGRTAIVVDVSSSMDANLSDKSQMNRVDAAGALAVLLRGITPECRVFQFGDTCREIPAHRGLGLIEAIHQNQVGHGTAIGNALRHVAMKFPNCQRVIMITDMQSNDEVGRISIPGYYVNVAPYAPALPARGNGWTIISGFSERIVDWIREEERPEYTWGGVR